jgi:glucan endo-1,6-beta-glucosidase
MMRIAGLILGLVVAAKAQSIQGLGVSGGNGPRGGIGDGAHPVMRPQAFITDAKIPSAPNTTRQLASGSPPRLVMHNRTSSTCDPRRRVLIDSSSGGARQEMLGFGHAWTGSTISNFEKLDDEAFDQVMQDLFGQEGNNMNFMRHTIGSSDLDGNQYTYDDNGPSFNEGEPDLDLVNFDLGPHGTAMAKMIARMGEYKGDVFLYGSPWSYPGWTKHNGLFIAPNLNEGSYSNIMNNSFDTKYIPQMVQYFTKYVDAFKDLGVTVNGLTLMNEPLNSQGGYPCMFLDAADEAAILSCGLGDEMQKRGVKVMAYDHNTDQPMYPMRVVQGAPDYTDMAAWHCYQGPVANYSVIQDFHYAYPDKLQFMTECSNYLPEVGVDNWSVAQNFIPPVRYGASGATMWVMATDPDYGPHSPYGGCAGCLGSIIVNSSSTYTKTNDYYMIGQFSRFIRRGSVNYKVVSGVEGTTYDPNWFDLIAIQNPDMSWAIVFMNNFGDDQDVVLSFTEGGFEWEGTVPNATVVTWLIPSDQIVSQSGVVPGYGGSGTTAAAGTGGYSTCPVTSSMASSSSASPTSTLEPVPHTTHVVAANNEYEGVMAMCPAPRRKHRI